MFLCESMMTKINCKWCVECWYTNYSTEANNNKLILCFRVAVATVIDIDYKIGWIYFKINIFHFVFVYGLWFMHNNVITSIVGK